MHSIECPSFSFIEIELRLWVWVSRGTTGLGAEIHQTSWTVRAAQLIEIMSVVVSRIWAARSSIVLANFYVTRSQTLLKALLHVSTSQTTLNSSCRWLSRSVLPWNKLSILLPLRLINTFIRTKQKIKTHTDNTVNKTVRLKLYTNRKI